MTSAAETCTACREWPAPPKGRLGAAAENSAPKPTQFGVSSVSGGGVML